MANWSCPPRMGRYDECRDRETFASLKLTGRRFRVHCFSISFFILPRLHLSSPCLPYIRANRFRLVLRAMSPAAVEHAERALEEVRRGGVANYFDDQRFGSVSGGEFVARAMVQGRYEDALRLALAAPYEHDRAAAKKEKAILRAHWGDWAALKDLLPRSHARSLVDYLLHHPDDFRGALERLHPELRGLYL